MLIKTLQVGMLETNCYVVTDEESMKCVIIDPGAESNTILDYIESHSLKPEAIFLTHGHFDHHMALENVLEAVNVPIYLSEKEVDRSGQNTRHKVQYVANMSFCHEGDIVNIGDLSFKIMETPGHSPGSITFMCSSSKDASELKEVITPSDAQGAPFTGDTLFCGDCGRTDLEGGSRETILKSLARLAALEGDYEVYPGHDEYTTLNEERRSNFDMKIATGVIS